MGKANRRYQRKKNRKQEAKQTKMENEKKRSLEASMKALMDEDEYAKALDVLAELVKGKILDAEDMYRGAYCYFMTGDYQRSAEWLTNTLTFEPAHVAARLLLARICILEDRVDDGMAIYDFILEHYDQALQPEQREDMEDILEYYVTADKERVKKAFPYVAAFMHVEGAETPAVSSPAQPSAVVEASIEAPEGADVRVNVGSGDARTSLYLPDAGAGASVAEASQPAPVEKVEPAEASIAQEADAQRERVLASDVSVAERVRLLNVFAGGYFVADELAAAKSFLAAALKLDAQDDMTLKNLAMLMKAEGDVEKALQFASAMHTTDFVLLAALKD